MFAKFFGKENEVVSKLRKLVENLRNDDNQRLDTNQTIALANILSMQTDDRDVNYLIDMLKSNLLSFASEPAQNSIFNIFKVLKKSDLLNRKNFKLICDILAYEHEPAEQLENAINYLQVNNLLTQLSLDATCLAYVRAIHCFAVTNEAIRYLQKNRLLDEKSFNDVLEKAYYYSDEPDHAREIIMNYCHTQHYSTPNYVHNHSRTLWMNVFSLFTPEQRKPIACVNNEFNQYVNDLNKAKIQG